MRPSTRGSRSVVVLDIFFEDVLLNSTEKFIPVLPISKVSGLFFIVGAISSRSNVRLFINFPYS